MGSKQNFERQVEAFLDQQTEGFKRVPAKQALLLLYEYVNNRAQDSEGQTYWTPQWCECVFQIHQVIRWSPLRVFLGVLAGDEQRAIRAAAKDILAGATGEYWHDEEAGIVGRVIRFMCSGFRFAVDPARTLPEVMILNPNHLTESAAGLAREFMADVQADSRIQRGMELWADIAGLHPAPGLFLVPANRYKAIGLG